MLSPEASAYDSKSFILQPWEVSPHELISWWGMEKFSAHIYLALSSYLKATEQAFQHFPIKQLQQGTLKEVLKKGSDTRQMFEAMRTLCQQIGLTISVKLIEQLMDSAEPSTSDQLAQIFARIEETIRLEIQDRLFMYIPSDRAQFYDQPELFGKEVNAKFATIQFDLVEAGNCYAAGRGTAVVFHLMRIMEIGVQSLGTRLALGLQMKRIGKIFWTK